MEKNKIYEGIVNTLGTNGEGIIKMDGYVVFVPFALQGEKILFKALKVAKNIVYGKLIEVLTPSGIRVRPKCTYFTKCGGCQLQHMDYKSQLSFKESKVADCFSKIANLPIKVSSAIPSYDVYRYRNNLQLPVMSNNGQTVIGFYAENSHRVVPIDDCFINPEWTKSIIEAFKEFFDKYNVVGYDEARHTGDVREITVKAVKGKLIITAVCLKENLKHTNELAELLKNKLKVDFSFYLNLNNVRTNVIYGDKFKLIYGEPFLTSVSHEIRYKIGVRSFMQVNDWVCSKIYSAVIKQVPKEENVTVIDAYSGAGLMTAMLAQKASKAIGIEVIPEAVKMADDLAKENSLSHKMINHLAKVEDVLPNIIEKEKAEGKKIFLVLDPPRKGCDIKVIDSIIKSDIDKLVYVSCNPSTLARDVGLLCGTLEYKDGELVKTDCKELRYNVESVRPYDMFPQTKHVETLVCLTRKQGEK